ncbi:PD-(D/E)XK nuclease family protein [bacterium]|nr:MAG: PD-(D/E)XK nuclease family protein [bacterium]
MVARKPTLSPTKITTYLACPVKFKWTYIDARGRWYLRSKSYYSFGTSLHRALERFHDSGDVGVQTTEEAVAALEESWVDAGYRSADEAAEALGEGREIVARYVEEQLRTGKKAKTLFTERQMRWDLGEFALIGRLDRLDEHEDGTLEIVDYKSGRSEVDPEEVRNDIAMSCYGLLVRRKYPDQPVVGTIVAIRTGASGSAAWSDEELNVFEEDLKKLGTEILTEDYPELRPVYKPLCPHCDFLPLCRRDPEFEEL